jgi:hypothetical protein
VLDGRAHVGEPRVALDLADREGSVPHPEARVAPLLRVVGWAAPVLGEEERQASSRRREVFGLRVEREQVGVAGYSVVEAVGERFEERESAHGLV